MAELTMVAALAGFVVTTALFLLTVIRQKRLELSDLGAFGAAYLAGSNIPAAVFLCLYAIYPDPESVPTKLHGYEKYVSFAGLSLLLLSGVTLWTLCQKAYTVTEGAGQKAVKGKDDSDPRQGTPSSGLKRSPDGAA